MISSEPDARAAARWARNILQCDPLILDTETTGLDAGEIVQIAVIDSAGIARLDTFVKPSAPIPWQAMNIHGITDAMVADAPLWSKIVPQLITLLSGREVIVYNASYDRRMMHQSDERAGIDRLAWGNLANWHCAMLQYAAFWGDWNEYRGNYRWVKLTEACRNFQIADPVAPAHSALGDCLRTLAVVRAMADAADEAVEAESVS